VVSARHKLIGPQQPPRIRPPGLRAELQPVHRVAAVGGQLGALAHLGLAGPGLGELPGHPADLDHRHAGPVRQHQRHLQQRPQLGPDRVRGGALERLGAVAALQDERLAPADRGQPFAQQVALVGQDQRRQPGQLGRHLFQPSPVRPVRLLGGRPPAPRFRFRHDVPDHVVTVPAGRFSVIQPSMRSHQS
jgi:hypothetical protein